MEYTNIIGYIAGALTTLAFFPQAVRIYRTRHTRDLSLPMYAVFLAGVLFWLCYGLILKSQPIIIANIVTIVVGSYILVMKIKYK